MPGEPGETLIGVVALGIGAILLAAAVKNVSPITWIKQAVTTGDIDTPGVADITKIPATDAPIVKGLQEDVAPKDSKLANDALLWLQNNSGNADDIVKRLSAGGWSFEANAISAIAKERQLGIHTNSATPDPSGGTITV